MEKQEELAASLARSTVELIGALPPAARDDFRSDAPAWPWEINVIQSDQLNAWCMPGGKIAFYSGLIEKLAMTDDEIAAVMGHEIAHALREHARERISEQTASQIGITVASVALGGGKAGADLGQMAYQMAFSLPHSRLHETEADRIGVELSARAGYDPHAAVRVWQKMAKLGFIHYNWPGFSFDEFLRFAAETGAGYVELQLTDVCEGDNFDEERAAQVRREVESHGLKVSALAARNDFVQGDPEAVAFQVDRMKRVAQLATILCDEPILRSEGGAPKDSVPQENWGDALYECFARCTGFADELGVTLAIDNHGIVTNDGDLLLALLRRVNHPRIGSNLDTMNFRWAANSITDCNRFYAELAPFVKHTHLKDGFDSFKEYRGAALGEGEIDLAHALTSLQNAGYDGVYLAEYEGPETASGVGYRKCIEWMKTNV